MIPIVKFSYYSKRKKAVITKHLVLKRNRKLKIYTPRNSVKFLAPKKISLKDWLGRIWYQAAPLIGFLGGVPFNAWWTWDKYFPPSC